MTPDYLLQAFVLPCVEEGKRIHMNSSDIA